MPTARRSSRRSNDRVIAIELADLKRVDRVVGIAGGRRKFAAIRGALRGRRINVLITDRSTAERLVKSARRTRGRSARRRTQRRARGRARVTPSADRRGCVKSLLWIVRAGRCCSRFSGRGRSGRSRAPEAGGRSTPARSRRRRGRGSCAKRRRRATDVSEIATRRAGASPAKARFVKGTGVVAAVDRQSRVGVMRVRLSGARPVDGRDPDRAGHPRHGAARRARASSGSPTSPTSSTTPAPPTR